MLTDRNNIIAQNSSWTIGKKLGEGDAGEVYVVESSSNLHQAILKRPKKSVFSGEVRRQADQIRLEGKILKALESLLSKSPGLNIKTPKLIDTAKPGSEYSDRYFIIIERAHGFDLNFLSRIGRMGLPGQEEIETSGDEYSFLKKIAKNGKIPERILVEAVYTVFNLFDHIHDIQLKTEEFSITRILWNDIKPDHLFWDPANGTFTIIDWGNGQLLEGEEIERGLRHTPYDDRRQFLEEMDHFLAQTDPDLLEHLKWPDKIPPLETFDTHYEALKKRVKSLRNSDIKKLALLHKEEKEYLQTSPDADQNISRIDELFEEIIGMGELPNYKGALKLATEMINKLSFSGELERVKELCLWAAGLPDAPVNYWSLLANLAESARYLPENMKNRMVEAVKSASANDWEGVLWNMVSSLQSNPEPDWWFDLTRQVRTQAISETVNVVTPLLFLRRLNLTLQAKSQAQEEHLIKSPSEDGEKHLKTINDLIEKLTTGVQNWVQIDPPPPYSGIGYNEIEILLAEIEKVLPGGGIQMQQALDLPGQQVAVVMEAWGRKEFINAERGLRRLLIFDPDRRRLFRAERAVQSAYEWLQRIQNGPLQGEHLTDYATNLEYEGRELRNEMGPTAWLDGILEGLKAIRQGAWPGDLFPAQLNLLNEMPWLRKYVRNEVLTHLLNPTLIIQSQPSIAGMRETHYGPENEISFIEPLDAWMPEARGSSARVYLAAYRSNNGEQREAAIKIMRQDQIDYALPLFQEETRVLNEVNDIPGVTRLLESGFLWMGGKEAKLPQDQDLSVIKALHGDAIRIGVDSLDRFWDLLEKRVREGWTPYLLLEKRKKEDCLFSMCDASLNHGHFLPVTDLLFMSIQICDILQAAHQKNVVYRDHKILHYYWQPENNGVSMLDWNVARYHPEGLTPYDIQMDLVQLGARGLHHIITGRTAPGALPLGPTRPEEIEQSAKSYAAQWTFDDQRLSSLIKTIIEQLLAGKYQSALELKEDLKRAYMNLLEE